MTWFSFAANLISLITIFARWMERDKVVDEVTAVERAKQINAINRSLVEASKIPPALANLSDEEIDSYVDRRGWYRD